MTVVTFDNPDALLLPRDVAEFRHMTTNALSVERCEGRGPRYVKLGGRVYYRAGDLAAYIEVNTVTPGTRASGPAPPQRH